MEADLQRWYTEDYRDRWRGNLTLRRIYVLITHLPPESAVAGLLRGGRMHWSLEAHLLDEVRIASNPGTKERPAKPHPSRPKPSDAPRKMTPERRRKIADARRRAHERRRAIEAGEIT